ncbi:MAG: hypothetical protein EOR22_09050 [Mesorhizobium sp.]|nr:MAG: hypothetical protein EOR22_09050 [Mesorhizobium sp.]
MNREPAGWTLQTLIDAGMSVTGGCLDCHRHQKLDLPALRDRFGADAPAMEWGSPAENEMCGLRRQAHHAHIFARHQPERPSPKESAGCV